MGKAERTYQHIVETAAPIFNKKGIAGTSIDDVLAAAKVAKGCLYGHFDSKEQLSYAVIDYNISLLGTKLGLVINKQKSAKLKLLAFINFFKSPMQSPIAGGCPVMNFGMEGDDTNAVVTSKSRTAIEKGINLLQSIVEEGIKAGEFDPAWDAKIFAIKTYTLIEGGTMVGRILGSNSQMKVIIKLLKDEIEFHSIGRS